MDTSFDFCSIRLPNPIVLGSGGLGATAEGLIRCLSQGAGAAITRTIRLSDETERRNFPKPCLAYSKAGRYLLNCEWGSETPWTYWKEGGIARAAEHGAVIVSISGRVPDEAARLVEALDSGAVAMFELNVSCSHANARFGRIGESVSHVERLLSTVRSKTRRPIMLKLGWSPWLADVATAGAAAGADAISATNAIGPGLDLNPETARPRLGIRGGRGGVSGPAIFPLALACVSDIVQTVTVPVMACGGVETSVDAVKMLMVGARSVQIYTAAMLRGPGVFRHIVDGLNAEATSRGFSRLESFVGLSRPYLNESDQFEVTPPTIDAALCDLCGACAQACPTGAIVLEPTPHVVRERCSGCGLCVDCCRWNCLH